MKETYDAALQLLDRQIIASDTRMVGKVDDVTIERQSDGTWRLTELLVGPGALGPRTGGLIGFYMKAVWERLSGSATGEPDRIRIEDVDHIDNAVHLKIPRSDVDVEGFEVWMREHVITRIPGAK
jgi:sporulation protein YlmC with PRC-barrel domain